MYDVQYVFIRWSFFHCIDTGYSLRSELFSLDPVHGSKGYRRWEKRPCAPHTHRIKRLPAIRFFKGCNSHIKTYEIENIRRSACDLNIILIISSVRSGFETDFTFYRDHVFVPNSFVQVYLKLNPKLTVVTHIAWWSAIVTLAIVISFVSQFLMFNAQSTNNY